MLGENLQKHAHIEREKLGTFQLQHYACFNRLVDQQASCLEGWSLVQGRMDWQHQLVALNT